MAFTSRRRPVQLDLFGEVVSAEQQRRLDALTCLRDAMPDALAIVAVLSHRGGADSRSPRQSGAWAYCVSQDGLRTESVHEWWKAAQARGEQWGWARTPAHLTTWDELHALISHDPRRAQVAAWMETLPVTGRWRWLTRPHELWPDADTWHPDHIERDHADPLWSARLNAWQLVLALLTDAIHVLEQP